MSESEEQILMVLATSTVIFVALLAFIVSVILMYQRNMANKQKELFKTALNTQENERERIARDLHDQVGPLLSGLKFKIDNIENEQDLLEGKEGSITIIDKIIDDLRRASHNLMPKVLYAFGLVDAIEDSCVMLSNANGLEIQFTNTIEHPLELRKDVQLNIFRAVQEILNNAVKYSKGNLVTVELSLEKDMFVVAIADNGQGFNQRELKHSKTSGIGVQNIHTRMELIDGACELISAPGKGTRYILSISKTKF